MIGFGQVVVDGFGDADYLQLIAGLTGNLGDLPRGSHGAVSAGVEEVADLVRPEDLQDPLAIFRGDFAARRSQRRRRGARHAGQRPVALGEEVEEVLFEDAVDAESRAIEPGDAAVPAGLFDDSQEARVDHRRRSSAVRDDCDGSWHGHFRA